MTAGVDVPTVAWESIGVGPGFTDGIEIARIGSTSAARRARRGWMKDILALVVHTGLGVMLGIALLVVWMGGYPQDELARRVPSRPVTLRGQDIVDLPLHVTGAHAYMVFGLFRLDRARELVHAAGAEPLAAAPSTSGPLFALGALWLMRAHNSTQGPYDEAAFMVYSGLGNASNAGPLVPWHGEWTLAAALFQHRPLLPVPAILWTDCLKRAELGKSAFGLNHKHWHGVRDMSEAEVNAVACNMQSDRACEPAWRVRFSVRNGLWTYLSASLHLWIASESVRDFLQLFSYSILDSVMELNLLGIPLTSTSKPPSSSMLFQSASFFFEEWDSSSDSLEFLSPELAALEFRPLLKHYSPRFRATFFPPWNVI